jgi:hypothetical protein
MCRTSTTSLPVRQGSTAEDYARIGVQPGVIRPCEDGMRTDGSNCGPCWGGTAGQTRPPPTGLPGGAGPSAFGMAARP